MENSNLHNKGAALGEWMTWHGWNASQLSLELGDGGQITKFVSGVRFMPLPLATRVSSFTGLPLVKLLSRDQIATARGIFAVMARDAGATE